MDQKLIFCIAFLIIFCCDISISSAAVSDFNDANKTLTIYENKSSVMTVRLISAEPDICTFTEVFEVKNFEAYVSDRKKDFNARTISLIGSGVTSIKWYVEKNVSYQVNVTDYEIIQVEETVWNNKTGKNETIFVNKTVISGYHDETRYRDVWDEYQPYDKEISKDTVQKIKVIYRKAPELGYFQIQTIPQFRGVECEKMTWWSGSWDRKRAIFINNTAGDSVTDYQLRSVNLSSFEINAESTRYINETSGSEEPGWNETVDAAGNLEYVWRNFSSIPSGGWINTTYSIYYQSSPSVSSVSDGDATFIQWHGFTTSNFVDSYDVSPTDIVYEAYVRATTSAHDINWGMKNTAGTAITDDAVLVESHSVSSRQYFVTRDEGAMSYCDEAPETTEYVWQRLKIVMSGATWHGYVDDGSGYDEISTGVSTNLPDENMGLFMVITIGTVEHDRSFARKYTANEPELWTVGDLEYPSPTPTPTPASAVSISPAQYDELDLPLILYILMISMLYLFIAFRNGIAAIELSIIYLIFAFVFILFQTVTMSVNYIYLILFLLLFMVSIAGITLKQGVGKIG